MSPELQILLTAVVTAVASALPGTYLVLRRTALVSDAISHALLPGIVVAFFLTHDLNSPLLLLSAAATGLLTVFLIEALLRSRLVPEDASIGLVFPAFFSIGVILISRYAGDIHLDTDSVLLGEIAWVPFDQMVLGGVELGPRALWTMSAILLLNLLVIGLAWKELKLATVDPGLAALLGFSPVAIHYSLMAMVSITAVGAFDAVGSILVVALMIAPPATAYLVVDRFAPMLWVGAVVAAASAVLGYAAAYVLDVSIPAPSWVTRRPTSSTSPSPDRWPVPAGYCSPRLCYWRHAEDWWPRREGVHRSVSSSGSACCWSICFTTRRPRPRPKNAGFRACTATFSGVRPTPGRWSAQPRAKRWWHARGSSCMPRLMVAAWRRSP
jgi:ABC-type Mn2+/Zn2+ transport system permease subunit